ncbi:MAG: ABC transporter substrate-binding protein, partial [Planctomycetes bacterium]|nr:ABC transporter substrate-binding protein [Planctomycetota bacterium]
LSSFDPNADTWRLYAEHRADGSQTLFTNLCTHGTGLVASAWCGGVWAVDPHVERTSGAGTAPGPSPLSRIAVRPHNETTVDVASTSGLLWWATQTELSRLGADDSWESWAIPHRTAGGFVHCMVASRADPEAKVPGSRQPGAWIGTDDGLLALVDWTSDTWVHHRRCDGGGVTTLIRRGRTIGTSRMTTSIPDNRVRCIAVDGADIWVGTANGLARGTNRSSWTGTMSGVPLLSQQCSSPRRPSLPGTAATAAAPVAIAIHGPRTRIIALPGAASGRSKRAGRPDLLAVQLALEYANRNGGYRGQRSFELATAPMGYGRYGWGTAVDDFPMLADYDNVAGIVGYFDASDRITQAVLLRTEVPFVNASDRLDTFDEAPGESPWTFRCWGDRPRQHRALLDYLFDRLGFTRVAALRTPGSDTQRHLDWWSSHARKRGSPLIVDLSCRPTRREQLHDTSEPRAEYNPDLSGARANSAPSPEPRASARAKLRPANRRWITRRAKDDGELDPALAILKDQQAQVVLTWTDTETSAAILRRMRELGMDQLFVGSRSIVGDEFIALAGENPGAVLALYTTPRRVDSDSRADFIARYSERNVRGAVPVPPDREAFFSYDAADHLMHAVNIADPGREALRQMLFDMSRDAYGEEHFEKMHKPGIAVYAQLKDGKWKFRPLPR